MTNGSILCREMLIGTHICCDFHAINHGVVMLFGNATGFVQITETRPPPPADPAPRWPLLTGTYRSSALGQIDVSVQAGKLQARFVDLNVTRDLVPVGYDSYYFDWTDPSFGTFQAQLTFWVDGTSPATYVVSNVGVGARS
jgi:hypothetical protein